MQVMSSKGMARKLLAVVLGTQEVDTPLLASLSVLITVPVPVPVPVLYFPYSFLKSISSFIPFPFLSYSFPCSFLCSFHVLFLSLFLFFSLLFPCSVPCSSPCPLFLFFSFLCYSTFNFYLFFSLIFSCSIPVTFLFIAVP